VAAAVVVGVVVGVVVAVANAGKLNRQPMTVSVTHPASAGGLLSVRSPVM